MKSRFSRAFSSVSICAVAALGLPVLAQSQEAARDSAMLVFDASGSMWGQIADEHKIEIARDAVANMLTQWNADTDLGLIAYGHNREGDCSDIEVLMTPQPLQQDVFSEIVNGLNPRGKTPLSDAVILAAEELGYTEAKATVILLTDGLETCERDPCEVAQALEERGIDFTAHVIAFDVAVEDQEALSCLASNTGGLYLQAEDMEDLSAALQEVSEAAAQPETVYDLGPATITVPDFVVVGHPFMAEWSGPKNPDDWLHVRDELGGVSFAGSPVGPADVGSPVEVLAPEVVGTYEIFYEVSPEHAPLASAVLNVVTVLPSVTVPVSVDAGSQIMVNWTGPGSAGDRIRLIDPETSETIATDTANANDDGTGILRAPDTIGTYEVWLVADSGLVLATTTFVTTPVSSMVVLPDGPFHVGDRPMQVEWSGPLNAGDRLQVFVRDEDRYVSQRPASGTAKSPIAIRLPREPGQYTLKLISVTGTTYAQQDFEVLPE